MISIWAFVTEADVEAYAATLLLPSYLAHLELQPMRFATQAENCDGREPLKLAYAGDGRREEFAIGPDDHALAMIRFVCPDVDPSRVHLPRRDAAWHWGDAAEAPVPSAARDTVKMRIYFAPTAQTLPKQVAATESAPDAYVSVTRGHVFVGRRTVESYVRAWLDCLGIDGTQTEFDFATRSGEIDFAAETAGGQLFVSNEVLVHDLMHFAGLDAALDHVADLVELDLTSSSESPSGVFDDGVYVGLSQRVS